MEMIKETIDSNSAAHATISLRQKLLALSLRAISARAAICSSDCGTCVEVRRSNSTSGSDRASRVSFSRLIGTPSCSCLPD